MARPWVVFGVLTLALAWAGDARAACGGLARASAAGDAAALGLSVEILGGESSSPLRPLGCAGAFCERTDEAAGIDFTGGVDPRADSWACVLLIIAPNRNGGARLIARSDAPRPKTGGDELLDPPR